MNDGMRVTGNPKQERQLHLDWAGSQSWHRICFILPARAASHIIILVNALFSVLGPVRRNN